MWSSRRCQARRAQRGEAGLGREEAGGQGGGKGIVDVDVNSIAFPSPKAFDVFLRHAFCHSGDCGAFP